MKITPKEIKIADLVEGYVDKDDEGVRGYSGRLNIRPPYQREFIYQEKERDAVIDTVIKGFPLNSIYWVDNGKESYEVLDGQQRIISICQYVTNQFPIMHDGRRYSFHTWQKKEKNQILRYPLQVFFCKGTDQEKLDWFKTINIAGKRLLPQELRNAVYHGSWVAEAKKDFSITDGNAHRVGGYYLKGSAKRQDYLETALRWLSSKYEISIDEYMAKNKDEDNSDELWDYFEEVIDWVEKTFPERRKQMKGQPWGPLFEASKNRNLNSDKLEDEVSDLMANPDINNKRGIYSFVLDPNKSESHLNLRAFDEKQRTTSYERQNRRCDQCNKRFALEEMEAHHRTPWSEGGRTETDNCRMLCITCHDEVHRKLLKRKK